MDYTARLLLCDVAAMTAQESVYEASRLMTRRRIGCVVIAEGRKIRGVFTERDLLNRVVAEGLPPKKTALLKVMTADPISVEAEEPLGKVFDLLARRRFRHLPITEGGLLAGIISLSDLAGVVGEVFEDEKYLQYFASYLKDGRRPPAA